MNDSNRPDQATVEDIVRDWPEVSCEAARTTMKKYGPPDEASAGRLVWHNNGPWRRTILYRDKIPHNFPTPHVDVLEQFVPYRVPAEKLPDLAVFDGSVLVDRTNGEISARCEGEEANFLALNLADDIVNGRKDVDSARQAYAEAMKAMMDGRPPEIMQRLTFDIPDGDTGEPDTAII